MFTEASLATMKSHQTLEARKVSSFRSAESMKGGGYTDTMECGSAVKSNELSSHKKTGMTLKCTWLSDRRKPVGNRTFWKR